MNKIVFVLTSIALLSAIALITQSQLVGQVLAQAQGEQPTPFVTQNTTKSMQDPLPGHESHQIVIAAPPRDDGKIYSGIASFTASQPVEVVMLHMYQPVANSSDTGEPLNAPFGDEVVMLHMYQPVANSSDTGEPLNAPFGDGKVAISLMNNLPILQ